MRNNKLIFGGEGKNNKLNDHIFKSKEGPRFVLPGLQKWLKKKKKHENMQQLKKIDKL